MQFFLFFIGCSGGSLEILDLPGRPCADLPAVDHSELDRPDPLISSVRWDTHYLSRAHVGGTALEMVAVKCVSPRFARGAPTVVSVQAFIPESAAPHVREELQRRLGEPASTEYGMEMWGRGDFDGHSQSASAVLFVDPNPPVGYANQASVTVQVPLKEWIRHTTLADPR